MHNSGRSHRDSAKQPAGRGRPRAFDRDAALTQATWLFWRKGYEATSMAELTDAMGIGSTSLYAAFGSKEALYTEALRHYQAKYDHLVWDRFRKADTAREAVACLLWDSAAVLTGNVEAIPRGCMVALSSVASEGYPQLGELVRTARSLTLERLMDRISRGAEEGELPASLDRRALARFVQAVQYGMSILARDGAGRAELEMVAELAMQGWDMRIGGSVKGAEP
jgi:AcrR family transcriptional regulator